MFELIKSKDPIYKGWYEVKHYWDDDCTIRVRYFKTKKEALKYLKEHT